MSSKLKSEIVKDFNISMNKIFNLFINQIRFKKELIIKTKKELKDIIKSGDEHHKFLLMHHISYIYKIRSEYISFSIDFPKVNLSTYDLSMLKKETTVTISTYREYSYFEKSTICNYFSLNFEEFENHSNMFVYLMKIVNDYNVLTNIQSSPVRIRTELFLESFKKENKFIFDLKNREKEIKEILLLKNEYIEKRKEKNKTKKDQKNNTKSVVNNLIKENEKKINELKKQIRLLELANKNIQNELISANSNSIKDISENLASLEKQYENINHNFIYESLNRKYNNNFNVFFEKLFGLI